MATDPSGAAGTQLDLTFRAETEAVRQALRRAVARFARQISADDAGALEIALAEVLNNIVEHAYAGLPAGKVHLRLVREAGALVCRVEDRGLPMPGLKLPDGGLQPVTKLTEKLAEGGWGWALIRAVTADLNYERVSDCNCVSFRVPLGGTPG